MTAVAAPFLATAWYADAACADAVSAVDLAIPPASFNATRDCTASASTAPCLSASSLSSTATSTMHTRSFCVSDSATAAATVFNGATYVQIATWNTCPAASDLASASATLQSSTTGLSAVSLYLEDVCMPATTSDTDPYFIISLNTSDSSFFRSQYNDSQCLALTSTTQVALSSSCGPVQPGGKFTSAMRVNTQGAIITIFYSNAACNTPTSLSFRQATTPCKNSDKCSLAVDKQAYTDTTCPGTFDSASLAKYLTTGAELFTHSGATYAIVENFYDNACSVSRSYDVTFLNTCVVRAGVDPNGASVLSEMLTVNNPGSGSSTSAAGGGTIFNGTLVHTWFSDSACLAVQSYTNYGVPDKTCRGTYTSTVVYGNGTIGGAAVSASSGLSTSQLGGIVTGCVVVAMVCATIGGFCVVRRRNQTLREEQETLERKQQQDEDEFDIDHILNQSGVVAGYVNGESPMIWTRSLERRSSHDYGRDHDVPLVPVANPYTLPADDSL
ncbi:hypothetical protein HDU83_009227 [Entophlyctis luteolus]|nr:hypothetical protein HDU82_003406 [Entophlyctis luteolus]KAJ3351148.1 hypothetical protein HDU83_009227 [Entophlyctis luteolus]KAJ3387334.1 hypothetical protein HDU84_000907 [Entophlyctis sp. JEL0112]